MSQKKKRKPEPMTLREIMNLHVIKIGGGFLISTADFPEFVRKLHAWSKDRTAR